MQLKHQNSDPALLRPISILEFVPRQQLQKRKMRVFHVKYPALFLVDVGSVNDDSFEFV